MSDLLPIAAQPVRSRLWELAAEPNIPPGTPSVQRAGPIAEVDTVDPVARLMLRAGIGQTVPQTARLWELANTATNFAGTTPMRGIRAFHGSPRLFDRFDIKAVDPAGISAYGHGLHFADAQRRAANLVKPGGALYEVRLNVDPARLLDWEAPIDAQPAEVRQALQGLIDRGVNYFGISPPNTGGAAYNAARRSATLLDAKSLGVDREAVASELLRRAGVLGNRYIDAGHGATPAYNYVLFDDAPIEILSRTAAPQ